MPFVRAQKVPKKIVSPDKIIAQFCYYFPAYTFQQAKELPSKYVQLMMKVARQENARKMYDLTQVVSAPHTKGGVKKALNAFKDIIEKD